MGFKPLIGGPTSALQKQKKELEQTQEKGAENIIVVFDDSYSMGAAVPGSAEPALVKTDEEPRDKTRIELAHEGLIEFMKHCLPKVTGIRVAPLNAEDMHLTKNLPALAQKVPGYLQPKGGTPLFEAMDKLHKTVKPKKPEEYNRAVIFTDGEPTDEPREALFDDLRSLNIPIDFIIIGNKIEANLSDHEKQIKQLSEQTGGTFLICKDGKVFKEKLKYFAPLLRHLLPAIASQES